MTDDLNVQRPVADATLRRLYGIRGVSNLVRIAPEHDSGVGAPG